MELAILVVFMIGMLLAFHFGYKAGKGESVDLIPKKFKPVVRTEEEEAKLIEKLRSRKK